MRGDVIADHHKIVEAPTLPELLAADGCLITRVAASYYKRHLVVGDWWLMHPDAYRLWLERETRALLRRCTEP